MVSARAPSSPGGIFAGEELPAIICKRLSPRERLALRRAPILKNQIRRRIGGVLVFTDLVPGGGSCRATALDEPPLAVG